MIRSHKKLARELTMTQPTFISSCADIVDPRIDHCKKYDLLGIMFLTLSTVLSRAEGWEDIAIFGKHTLDWLGKFRPFISGIARHGIILECSVD